MEIVSAVRAALADKVGRDRYELWFGSGTQLHYDGAALVITAPNLFFQDWVRANFRRDIEAACQSAMGACPALRFEVDQRLEEPARENHAAEPNGTKPVSEPRAAARVNGEAGPGETAGAGHGKSRPAAGGPLRRRFANFDSFVTGDSNRLARASAELAASRPGDLSPLVIHGPTGVGKTHLLEAIWTAARSAARRFTVVYLSAEQFTTYFLEALRGSGLPSFRSKYRGVDLLILDDVQFFSGKRATQVELLYTIDTLLREGRQVTLAVDRPPAELADLGRDLVTRLESGMVCRIDPPEHGTRLGIVAQMAARLGLHLPHDVEQFIAASFRSHARELSGALCRLHAASRALGRAITLETARETLSDMLRSSDRVVRLADIQKAVCDVFRLEPASLAGGGKGRGVSYPRMLAMWLARKHTRAALSEIGHFFGRRSHSTVVSAQKRVDSWLAKGGPVQLADRAWDADEAIRQVEKSLRAG